MNTCIYSAVHVEVQGIVNKLKKFNVKKIFHQHNLEYISFFQKYSDEKNLLFKLFYLLQYKKSYSSEKNNLKIANLIISTGKEDTEEIMKMVYPEHKVIINLIPRYELKEKE